MTVLSWQQLTAGGNENIFKGGTALTVGCFDGPHSGHDVLFDEVFRAAGEKKLLPGIVTFSRPLPVLKHPDDYAGDIATLRQRLSGYERRGFAFCIVIDFSDDFSKISGNDFLTVLKTFCGMKFLAEGPDFHCGHNGSFGMKQISEFAEAEGIAVSFPQLVLCSNCRISSSLIRKSIRSGDFETAEKMLGHPYELDFEGCAFKKSAGTYEYAKSSFLQVLPPDGMYNVMVNTSGLRACLEASGGSILVHPAGNELPRIRSIQFLYKE